MYYRAKKRGRERKRERDENEQENIDSQQFVNLLVIIVFHIARLRKFPRQSVANRR